MTVNKQTICQFLQELKKGPAHLMYFLKNVHPIRDHFPALYNWRKSKLKLDLGEKANFKRIHVVLRTTDSVMNLNASRNLEDVGIKSKHDVIRVGGCSLFAAAKEFVLKWGNDRLRLTLVTDRLSDEGLELFRSASCLFDIDFDVVQSKGHGNGPSFQTQIDVAIKDDDDTLELILEDDYRLSPETLVVAFDLFCAHRNLVGFNPHFHPDRIRFQDIGRIVVCGGRLYCRIPSTCCTFFMPNSVIRKNLKSLRLYDGWEKGSIGNVWNKGVCLSPLGWTLAEHLHRSDLSPVSGGVVNIKPGVIF